ncbi:MAG: type II toxin-antitoxin system PemK/MazF family toxin [bacterium]|nr:type II toxin-antitoxin system PemK/MazF family toxin [bacterium]
MISKKISYERGDVVLVAFSPVVGSEQADTRPAIVVSNELFHRLRIVTVAAVTSRKRAFPGRVSIDPDSSNGISKPSDVLAFQLRTISTNPKRILKKLGKIAPEDLKRLDVALRVVLKLG